MVRVVVRVIQGQAFAAPPAERGLIRAIFPSIRIMSHVHMMPALESWPPCEESCPEMRGHADVLRHDCRGGYHPVAGPLFAVMLWAEMCLRLQLALSLQSAVGYLSPPPPNGGRLFTIQII